MNVSENERLLLDPLRCDGVGMCAFLAPDVIGTDRWGYPTLDGGALSGRRLAQARRAVRACPRAALALEAVAAPAPAHGASGPPRS